jgi:enoyl-CoA hydratase
MGDILLEANDLVAVSNENGKLIVRFTSPATRNPISRRVLDYLEEICTGVAATPEVKEVVFTGTGDAFASGADLREIAGLTSDEAREFSTKGQLVFDSIVSLKAATLAMINGFCYGGGLDLSLACKRRIASSNATFCHPGAGLGIITGWGGTQRLPRLVGEAKALELFFTAAPITAMEALRIGLVDHVYD